MTTPLDGLLDLLADRIADRVLERIGKAADGETYTTAKGGPLLPGKSRDWMRRNVRGMPGARKVGRDWVIARADYEAWLAARDDARAAKPRTVVAKTSDDVAFAIEMLAKAGVRPRGKVA